MLITNELRPLKLKDVCGQEHLTGKDGIITNLVKNKKMFSMILYGNPGTGKTSIAHAIVSELNAPHRELNMAVSKKQDIDIVIEEAKMAGSMLVIIDEIHRMDKAKQDILLPHIESGLLTVIGLTTSNPYYVINPAIRSRMRIIKVNPLSNEDIEKILKKATKKFDGIKLEKNILSKISALSSGDARSALNLLEVLYYSSSDKKITSALLEKVNEKPVLNTDKAGNNHYELLSALQKSIRGSDVNAALYYLANLISIGDLDSIFRRLSVIVYEDIGLANASLGPKLRSVIETVNLVGMPEGRIPLSVLTIEMALSPKSNSAYLAIDKALNDINSGNVYEVPNLIKGHNPNYKYPHNYPKYFVNQDYLPEELKGRIYYNPKLNKYEQALKNIDLERYRFRKKEIIWK